MSHIIRTTRASAANLATAQRHHSAAERATRDAAAWDRTRQFLAKRCDKAGAIRAEAERDACLALAKRAQALESRAWVRHRAAFEALIR